MERCLKMEGILERLDVYQDPSRVLFYWVEEGGAPEKSDEPHAPIVLGVLDHPLPRPTTRIRYLGGWLGGGVGWPGFSNTDEPHAPMDFDGFWGNLGRADPRAQLFGLASRLAFELPLEQARQSSKRRSPPPVWILRVTQDDTQDTRYQQIKTPPSVDLIGQPGSHGMLPTPALVLDLDLLSRNLALMTDHCQRHGLGLRPHAKTHKSAKIAQLQMDAGAVGICCAKLAEAEALAAQGIQKVLLTSPIVTKRSLARAIALSARMEELIVTVDNQVVAVDLQQAAEKAGPIMNVVVDLDVGLHRTGIAPGDGASALAHFIDSASHLRFRGLQAYAGHLMHVHDFADRKTKSLDAMKQLGAMRDRLGQEGIACEILTGGGTGTFNIDPEAGVLTDLQGGSYVFMDREYNEVPIANNAPIPFETALFVQTTVISTNTPGLVTTDAGLKSFSTDADPPIIASGAPDGASFFFFGDEQGGVLFADKKHTLALGAAISCVVPHCDPTVNLYDWYHCVRGDVLVDIWPVDARGCSQ